MTHSLPKCTRSHITFSTFSGGGGDTPDQSFAGGAEINATPRNKYIIHLNKLNLALFEKEIV